MTAAEVPLVAALAVALIVGSAVSARAAEPTVATAVEDFAYPDAAGILTQRGITLKTGDGHIQLADCDSQAGLIHLRSRSLADQACFKITGPVGYLALEIPEVYTIKGDDHAIKATLSTQGTVTSVDINRNAWTPVGEGASSGVSTLLELNATDGSAVSVTNPYPGVGTLTVGAAGRTGARGCTATLIAPEWVLSAASCFADDPNQPATVKSGPPPRPATVTFTGHPAVVVTGLVPRADRDLVLARLAFPIVGIAPAGVATAAPAVDQNLQAAGVGRTATEWAPAAPHVGAVTVTAVAGTTIAATPPAGVLCQGDAGGPAFTVPSGGGMLVAAVHSRSGQAGCLAQTSTVAAATEARVDDLASWIATNTPRRPRASSDVNGDGRTDVAMTGGGGWSTLPVAFSQGDGTATVTNAPIGEFANWATSSGVRSVTGDFNGDGRTDFALTGGPSWSTLPVAMSKGDGTFTVTNAPITDFGGWASNPAAKVVSGDFNGDGKADLALSGVSGWTCVPVAFSKGDGTFTVTCAAPGLDWLTWAANPNARLASGDFNGDGRTDLALTGGYNWSTLPVAMSKGDGTFTVTNAPIGEFANWVTSSNVRLVSGDFNADGRTDLALTGGPNWSTLPVAMSKGDGTFTVTNAPITDFGGWASNPAAKVVTGDFNGDGRADLVMTGASGWTCIPVALSNGDGTFTVTCAAPALNWVGWAAETGAKVLAGDFDGDGRADLALTGGAGWNCLPMARSKGDGTFTVTCSAPPGADWGSWAAQPGARIL
ncbi:FG-GAP-like repeat-containing protein [Longispora fulva]|uniref:V8-like Glu-specific endopeptidase n=1 Tax=Longispora fulva TaxID=619741 RepID=A0A8J7GRV4_9ACTN|nr:FG-GAP-like repeat-containing protein [Longispora fulva]MBG6135841.1 V8-like Glu-specific endopeptidase [Longispora fulva]